MASPTTDNEIDKNSSMAKIFEAVPVVEKILEFSMWNFHEIESFKALEELTLLGLDGVGWERSLRISDVANLRLVNSSFFDTTTQILRCKRTPFLYIQGGIIYGMIREGTEDEQKAQERNNIGRFVNLLTSKEDNILYDDIPELEIPTFSLKLNLSYFTKENHAQLADCFLKLGSGLVLLKFEIPVDATMPMEFPPFSLPLLDKLKVQVGELTLEEVPAYENPGVFENGRGHNFLAFLQIILDASEDLRQLTFYNELAYSNFRCFPDEDSFKGLRLPNTLRIFKFKNWMTPLCLEMLLAPQNKLSQLTSLTLFHLDQKMTFSTELLYELFQKLSGSLKHLYVEGWPLERMNKAERTKLKFPLMPKLKSLLFRSGRWTLMDEKGNGLDQFPELEILKLVDVLEAVFWNKWTNHEKMEYGSLKRLNFPLLRKEKEQREDKLDRTRFIYAHDIGHFLPRSQTYRSDVYSYKRVTSGVMRRIDEAFPNLTELYLTFLASPEVSGFTYLFGGKLNRLKKLEMVIYNNIGPGGKQIPKEFWDSVLTGLSVEKVQHLRQMTLNNMEKAAGDMKTSQIDGSGDGQGIEESPSIRALTELKSLFLSYPMCTLERGGAKFVPLISDVSFLFGFLKMPKVEKLQLAGGFKATPEMEKRWRDLRNGDDKSFKYWLTRSRADVFFN